MRRLLIWIVMVGIMAGCDINLPPSRRSGLPPGHGGIPPGHGGIPPGQAKKMGPPPIVVVGIPSFKLIPGSNVSVMVEVDAEVFRANGLYYYLHDRVWYTGRSHRGPWKTIAHQDLPPGLRGRSSKKPKVKGKGRKKNKR